MKAIETADGRASAPAGRHKFLYYALGLTPPVEHAQWVRDDISTSAWLFRNAAQNAICVLLGLTLLDLIVQDPPRLIWAGAVIGSLVGVLIQTTLLRGYVRRRTLAHHEKRWAEQRPR